MNGRSARHQNDIMASFLCIFENLFDEATSHATSSLKLKPPAAAASLISSTRLNAIRLCSSPKVRRTSA